jgi:hypothetical protein
MVAVFKAAAAAAEGCSTGLLSMHNNSSSQGALCKLPRAW